MLFIPPTYLGLPSNDGEMLLEQSVQGDDWRQPLDVVFVGAHPDDIEIACGGTAHRLASQGYRVGIIDLTDGEPTPLSESPEVRWAEAREASRVLGIAYRRLLPLTNRRLMDGFEERLLLAKEFRFWKPKIVVGFGNKTPLASPDHYQAMQITDAAVFYSRLTKWDEHFANLPTHTIRTQLYFQLAFEPTPVIGFDARITVDIGDSLEKKLEAISCYKTQFPESKSYVYDRVRSLAVAAGAACDIRAGEVFASTRSLATRDLVKAFQF